MCLNKHRNLNYEDQSTDFVNNVLIDGFCYVKKNYAEKYILENESTV